MEASAAFFPNHQVDFIQAKALFDTNLELYKTPFTRENCTDVANAGLRVREAVASFETIAILTDHPDFFYAAMILYHFGNDRNLYQFNATTAHKYKALAIATCNNVLSQAGHKDTPAADLVLRALEDSIYATFDDGTTFDDGIIYHGPTPFKF